MRPEDTIQDAIVVFVRTVAPSVRIAAVPNAARRTEGGRASNAVPGLTPGWPDLAVALPGGRTLWWEVKTPKGRLDPPQIIIHADLVALDHAVTVVRSIDDARGALAAAGIETREAGSPVGASA